MVVTMVLLWEVGSGMALEILWGTHKPMLTQFQLIPEFNPGYKEMTVVV